MEAPILSPDVYVSLLFYSDTPLLYRAVPSWFMRVEQMRETLLARNDETYWVPETIREGRFANWLKDARDWNISRSRYVF